MRIVIDLQGAQTESRFRGIGRYSLAFARAVVKHRGDHEVILALNGMLGESVDQIRAVFEPLLPKECVRVWSAPGPVRSELVGADERRQRAEFVREAFLQSLEADVVHVTSLFEGYEDDAITSIGAFDTETRVSISLYDLIPFLNPAQYLDPKPRYNDYYKRKLGYLGKADLVLAISEHAKSEGTQYLGNQHAPIVNIGTAADEAFCLSPGATLKSVDLLKRLEITREFVLYSGGADERKNLPRLIEAWSRLPPALRQSHQLVFAGRMPEARVGELKQLARRFGMLDHELIFSKHISDEDLVLLYSVCKLYVLASWHEGFGLPALEAMACGAPVIGANTTSLPEVIGDANALFDPFDVPDMTHKIAEVLQSGRLQKHLRDHGLERAGHFSWQRTAQRAIKAWEDLKHHRDKKSAPPPVHGLRKPRLAFVSPLPPERTGIAGYSIDLLPALSQHYEIDLVTVQEQVHLPSGCDFPVRNIEWLREHRHTVDRVLYQMGNSPFHAYMLPLMEDLPGTVVLHDFYLGHLAHWIEEHRQPGKWRSMLYSSHGYKALQASYADPEHSKFEYPVNWDALGRARGIVVHSKLAQSLIRTWYDERTASECEVVPLVRTTQHSTDRAIARQRLGIDDDAFMVCSFGFLDPAKLNHRVIKAWMNSRLRANHRCLLVMVGENHGGEYGRQLFELIDSGSASERIRITGFTDQVSYTDHLAAADLAVQLRERSRGETSAAALDCMNHGVPLIVNGNGSMAELCPNSVRILPNEFTDHDLIHAMESLFDSADERSRLGASARDWMREHHSPEKCAQRYFAAIERGHRPSNCVTEALINRIASHGGAAMEAEELQDLSIRIAGNLPSAQPARRLFLDITATANNDLKTGIERVAKTLMLAFISHPLPSYRTEPVYLKNKNGDWHYQYARRYTLDLLGCPSDLIAEEPIDPQPGDLLLTLDLSGHALIDAEKAGLYKSLKRQGLFVFATVFDLLPIQLPHTFPPGADRHHREWLDAIASFDGAFCISQSVAADLQAFCDAKSAKAKGVCRPAIRWFHLGSDLKTTTATHTPSRDLQELTSRLRKKPTFLMVGTIEPRKGYLQAIEAFELLWRGHDIHLVIVGKEGWKNLPDSMRRDIPETLQRLRDHPELGQRLFWLEGISDDDLENIYEASSCLIAASHGEGFGLPLVEAANHRIPILARNVPVFKEVVGSYATFFSGENPRSLADGVAAWLATDARSSVTERVAASPLTWKESADALRSQILELTAKRASEGIPDSGSV